MKRAGSTMADLTALYDSKIAQLQKLIVNQRKQLDELDYGKGEISAAIARGNEKIIQNLIMLDQEIEKIAENTPGNAVVIAKTQAIFALGDEARKNQESIQEKMESFLREVKKDLNTIQVKRQLLRHLNATRIWQSSHC